MATPTPVFESKPGQIAAKTNRPLAIELTGTGQLKPGLKMLGYGLVKQRAFGVARVVELGFGTR
jgi:hypothetical protein